MKLATFSGKFGDILWSLPTVRALSRRQGLQLDMMVMPAYESLLPLLEYQPYIRKAYFNTEWICTGSPWGDQPWEAPIRSGIWDEVWHLTYRHHPSSSGLTLCEFIASQQGISSSELLPAKFLEAPDSEWGKPCIAWAFNGDYENIKDEFRNRVMKSVSDEIQDVTWINVAGMPWLDAAAAIKSSVAFMGCRSANYVLATGLGVPVVCFEPCGWRKEHTYAAPSVHQEFHVDHPETAAQLLKQLVRESLVATV